MYLLFNLIPLYEPYILSDDYNQENRIFIWGYTGQKKTMDILEPHFLGVKTEANFIKVQVTRKLSKDTI